MKSTYKGNKTNNESNNIKYKKKQDAQDIINALEKITKRFQLTGMGDYSVESNSSGDIKTERWI